MDKIKSIILPILTLVVGGAIASFATWKIAEKRKEEEIDSVKEELSKLNKTGVIFSKVESPDEIKDEEPKKNISTPSETKLVSEMLERDIEKFKGSDENVYVESTEEFSYSPEDIDRIIRNESKKERPYIISPEEFGEISSYEKISLTYYIDGVLADDDDEVIYDIENIIGNESLNHFGEYEDDSIFVRNDKLKCDYEVLLDQREFSKMLESKPYKQRDREK